MDKENQENFEHFYYEVEKGQNLLRIDKFLMNKIKFVTRNKIQTAAKNNHILVNNLPVKSNYRVKPSDIISIVYDEPKSGKTVFPENIPLSIVYEDENLIVINKPAGMVTHPVFGNNHGTLLNALEFIFNPEENKRRPYIVHRLDKDTSGLIVLAKDKNTLTSLLEQFCLHTISRNYLVLVWGNIEKDNGTINAGIYKDINKKGMIVSEKGKRAVTHYQVLERFGAVTLITCRLETGRTNQIRVHMKHIGHPVFSDLNYGGKQLPDIGVSENFKNLINDCFGIIPRQALHAQTLGFIHPGKNMEMLFEAPLPDDFKQVIEKFRLWEEGNWQ